jgi:hypothetical protein
MIESSLLDATAQADLARTGEVSATERVEAAIDRIEVLHEDIEQADHHGDATASRSATSELDALLRELSASGGLGGRDRRLGDEVERARKTVSAQIRDSLRRVAAIHPELGSHLEASITLGVRCSYQPLEPVAWRL